MVVRTEFVKCGKKTCTKCPHGPYLYKYWKGMDGKVYKKYLGKAGNMGSEFEEVIAELNSQAPTSPIRGIRKGVFYRGIEQKYLKDFMKYRSSDELAITPFDEDEAIEFCKTAPYEYDPKKKVLTAEGINALTSPDQTLEGVAAPMADVIVKFEGMLLGDNVAGDGLIVVPQKVLEIRKRSDDFTGF